ncbi:hypothetical protein E1A90_23745 [Bacillus mycoides]|nr:hypothetical protein E1A90_23745 [Bacillus mycoides]
MESNFSIIGFLISLVPLFLIIFVFRWIRFIYQNSEKQVEQNEKIIELLMEIKEQKNVKMNALYLQIKTIRKTN